MTTKTETEIKFKPLMNLTDANLVNQWWQNIKNVTRKHKVTDIDKEGKKIHMGNLFLLLKTRVFVDEDGDLPDGDDEIKYNEKEWSETLTIQMESELWGICYAAMGDTLRNRMSEKFDKEDSGGEPPMGTELLRFIQTKKKLIDPRAQERKAKADRDEHLATTMPPGTTSEQMHEWCDKASALNDKCANPMPEHELIEATIAAFPDDVIEKIENKTEHSSAHEDYDAAQTEWAGVLERHAEREKKRAKERAMSARSNDDQSDSTNTAALQKMLEAQAKTISDLSTKLESALAARVTRPSSGHPYHAACGAHHPGGDDACWLLHPELVPQSMARMLPGIHKKRAAKGLPDLSSKYPAPAAGQMCVAIEVVERAFSSAEETEARGRMLVDSMASVDLAHDIDMFDAETLAPCTGKQVRVASGQVLSATHTGTLLLVARDTDGVWRMVRREGAWLVPGLTANLLSVRAGKSLGCRAPDFDALVLYGPSGERWPMVDCAPDYVLETRLVSDAVDYVKGLKSDAVEYVKGIKSAIEESSAMPAVIARGRKAIPTSSLSMGDAAGIVQSVFGHASSATIKGALDATRGLDCATITKIKAGLDKADRTITTVANMQAKPSPAAELKDMDQPGYVLTDMAGPFPRCSVGPFRGARYYILYLDTATDFCGIYFLSTKKPAGVVAARRMFVAECRALNPAYAMRVLRADRGGEYDNDTLKDDLASDSILCSFGAPYHPDHNRIEPQNNTVKRFMRSGLAESRLEHALWPYFAKQAIETRNMYARAGGKSAVELMSGGKTVPKITHLRPIGCKAVVKKTDRELVVDGSSLAPRGHEGIYLGTDRNSPAYMVYVPTIGKVRVSADVDFFVNVFPGSGFDGADGFDGHAANEFVARIVDDPDWADEVLQPRVAAAAGADDADQGGQEEEGEDAAAGVGAGGAAPAARPTRTRRPAADPNNLEQWGANNAQALAARCADLTSATGATDALDLHDLVDACDEGDCILLQQPHDLATNNFTIALRTGSAYATKVLATAEALNGDRADEHRAAIKAEIGGHLKVFGTYTLIPITEKPLEASLIDLKLILAEKFGALGEFLKAKARLVARGDQEVAGFDFDPWRTWSPMLRYSTLRLLCALAALTGRPLHSSDAVQAYLNANLQKPRYGRLPKELREYSPDGIELIAFIRRALYGLAESGHAWNKEINTYLTTSREEGGMGFARCYSEPCAYVRTDPDGSWAIIGLACDNAIHLESSDEVHAEVMGQLQSRFQWVDEGPVSDVPSVLGTKITQDTEAGVVTMSQEGFVSELEAEFADHLLPRRVSTPSTKDLERKVLEASSTRDTPCDPKLKKQYQRLVGAMLFKSIVSGPDVAWAASMLARAMSFPTAELLGEAYHCLSYLVQHKHLPMRFTRDSYFSARTGTTVLRKGGQGGRVEGAFAIDDGHADADFAAGPSVSGWVWRMAGAGVLFGSKRQSSTMLDSASAELVSGSVAATDGIHLRNLLGEKGFPQLGPSGLWIDNKATVALAHDPQSFNKTKHVARRHHYLRECVDSGVLEVKHISTEFNIADIFTKALEPKKFRLFRAAVMNLPVESLLA